MLVHKQTKLGSIFTMVKKMDMVFGKAQMDDRLFGTTQLIENGWSVQNVTLEQNFVAYLQGKHP